MMKVVEALEVISWMDDARWEDEESQQSDVIEEWGSSKKLLVHWLIYIADRQTQVRGTDFWKRGCKVYLELVENLPDNRGSNDKSVKEFKEGFLDNFVYEYPYSDNDKKFHHKFHGKEEKNQGKTQKNKDKPTKKEWKNEFTPRLPLDRYLTLRTIYFLNKYYNNDFLGYLKKNYKPSESGYDLDRIAYLLYLLSYSNPEVDLPDKKLITKGKKLDDIAPIFDRQVEEIKQKSENIDNDDFESWKGNEGKYYFKRVWAGLRDYIKHPFFKDAFSEAVFGKKWESPPPDLLRQLQLPGDLWNIRSPLITTICDELDIPYKNTSKLPKLARDIYTIQNDSDFYPEQFDVTFDFSPNMNCGNDDLGCKKEICPFSGGALDICSEKEDKPCTVLLITCGYNVKCKPRNCPIQEEKGKGFCEGT